MDAIGFNPVTLERRRRMTQDQVRALPAPLIDSSGGLSRENGSGLPWQAPAWKSKTGIGPMKSGLFLSAAAAAMLICVSAGQAAQSFVTLQDTGAGAATTEATGINNAGQIVGNYIDSNTTHGFSYSGGSYTTIDVPSSAATTASGVSNGGQVTGSYTDGGGGSHGFGGSPPLFDDPGGIGSTTASGINTTGTIVGSFYDGTNTHGYSRSSGAIFTTLDAPGAVNTTAYGINDGGTIVGSFFDGTTTHGFVDVGGVYTQVDDPLGVTTSVYGINTKGDIVGSYADGGGVRHGFVELGGTFTTVDDPNAGPGGTTEIFGINDQRMVVGYFVDPNLVISGFSADVPEPGMLAMFCVASLGMVTLRLRRGLSA
jgi:probable HAF family extracellular repeat protein